MTSTARKILRGAHLSVAAAAALALAGCGVGGPVDAGKKQEVAAAASEGRTLKLAHVYDAAHPVEKCGVATLKEELAGSGINIQSYPSGQLGSEAQALEQVAGGALDMSIAGPSFLGVWHEPAAVLDGAYLFDGVDHFAKTLEGDTLKRIYSELKEKSGLQVLSGWYYGTRHVTSNKPITTPEDMKGLKIRTPDAPQYMLNTKIMGGTATPMALGEVYLGLQQGVIDAQENPVPTIATSKFNEVQKYINLTGHLVQAVNVVTSASIYDSLDEAQKTALDGAMDAASASVRKCVETAEQETLDKWKKDGSITVNEDVDRAAFMEQAREALPGQVSWGELYKEIQASK
ncbi:sialic acid TRAP transporter substrate-binding protein SiaP [Pseudarthrobacter sp. NPDC058362]|uniref:sialic acid TRAP transporter substrate-binding protein SiaP n=1 Tax=Pseudarthrobacter sp. NPDC058362 TaxID=3346458 RepID=UPI0036523F89